MREAAISKVGHVLLCHQITFAAASGMASVLCVNSYKQNIVISFLIFGESMIPFLKMAAKNIW